MSGRVLIQVCNVPEKEYDAVLLKEWRNPTKAAYARTARDAHRGTPPAGDFAAMVKFVMEGRLKKNDAHECQAVTVETVVVFIYKLMKT